MSKLAHSNEETMKEIEARSRFADQQASYFAMCLLMPEDLLRKEAAKYKGVDLMSDKWIKALAIKFRVAENLLLIRLGQIGLMENQL